MKQYNIWMEGFRIMGERAEAEFLGAYEGESFLDACKKAADDHPGYGGYNPEHNTIWGCRLFDNEKDARKSFG